MRKHRNPQTALAQAVLGFQSIHKAAEEVGKLWEMYGAGPDVPKCGEFETDHIYHNNC